MGLILNGILGNVSGKVSGVVGGTWKSKAYLRGYAKPANPNTAGQQAQRGKFSFSVAFAQTILSSVINKFWEQMDAGMSGFNSFQKRNIVVTNATTGITVSNKTMVGSLEPIPFIFSQTYDAVSGDCVIDYSDNILGNGLATDSALIVIYDKANNVSFVSDNGYQRGNPSATVNIGAGRVATNLICFISAYRGIAPNYLMSNSNAVFFTAA